VNVTTVIKYLIPGSATTNAGEFGPVALRRTVLLLATVLIAISSWPETATLAIALRTAGGGWPSRADGFFMGGRDDFSWEV
jgi:hypothetical protein